jgi:outer membrane beta-barrel protein
MMRRALPFVVLLAVSAPAFAADKAEEEAGDVSEVDKDRSGPLRDRVRPVSGHLFLMKGRFELSPEAGFSFKDSFYFKVVPGLLLAFHITETVGVQLRAGFAINFVSSSAEICKNDPKGLRGCMAPTLMQLDSGSSGTLPYGRMGFFADLNLEWAPIYGKLGTLAVLPFLDMVHFNMYVALGPAFMIALFPGAVPIGGNVDFGFRFFITRFVTLRWELRDVIYYETLNTGSIRNQLMLDVGLSIFLPTDFTRE